MNVSKRVKVLVGVLTFGVVSLLAQPALVTTQSIISATWTLLKGVDIEATDDLTVGDDATITGSLTVTEAATFASNVEATSGTTVYGSGLLVGLQGTSIRQILTTNVVVDIGATATNATSTANITVPGAGTNSVVSFNLVSPSAKFRYNAFVSATNTVTIHASNISITDAENPAATEARFTVFQY